MTDNQIKHEKLQYHINREAAEISALSSGSILRANKYCLLQNNNAFQSRIIKQAKFTYSSLGKSFEKQKKTIEDQEEKQIKALEEHEKRLVESNWLIKNYYYDTKKGSALILKLKGKFNSLLMKDKIKFLKVNEKNSINELTCNFKDKRTPKLDFHCFGNTITCFFKK